MDDLILTQHNNNLHMLINHKRAFYIDDFYPLKMFEHFVELSNCGVIECSTKIQQGRIHAARFYLEQKKPGRNGLAAALNYFRQVSMRADIELDFRLLDQFLGADFDMSHVSSILVGVDARREIKNTCLKLLFVSPDKFGSKMQEAMELAGIDQGGDFHLKADAFTLGFDFRFDGHTASELYADFFLREPHSVATRQWLAARLSPNVVRLLEDSTRFGVGVSKDNPSNIIYFIPRNSNDCIVGLRNELAKSVHAYYQRQPDVSLTGVGCQESDASEGIFDNINLYYRLKKYTISGCTD